MCVCVRECTSASEFECECVVYVLAQCECTGASGCSASGWTHILPHARVGLSTKYLNPLVGVFYHKFDTGQPERKTQDELARLHRSLVTESKVFRPRSLTQR